MKLLRWMRTGGPHMGAVGKAAAGGVFAACLLVGSLVGLLLGDVSLGGNVGALVGLLVIAVNVTLSQRYVRRRFDPAKSRAEGEILAREARLRAGDADE